MVLKSYLGFGMGLDLYSTWLLGSKRPGSAIMQIDIATGVI